MARPWPEDNHAAQLAARSLSFAFKLLLPAIVALVAFLATPLSTAILTALALLLANAILAVALADGDIGLMACRHKESTFKDKTVLVVGASTGLGAALAKHLAREGAVLILASRDVEKLQAVKGKCEGPNQRRAAILLVDVTSSGQQLDEFATSADAMHGGVDFAFLAAGGSQSAVAEETQHEVAKQVLQLNAEGCMAVGRALLRKMLERRRGHLVPIASMAALVPSPGQAEYAAAKHAVLGYFASVAAEVADRNVSVTVACPGPIAGEDVRSVFGAQGRVQKEEDASSNSKKVPMARCCRLICDAVAHGRGEAWIARHPVLAMAYLSRLVPALAAMVLRRVGPKRARALRDGKSGYDYGLAKDE